MDTTRRSVLGAVATLATVGAGSSQVIAQESLPIEVTQVASEEEYVVFENTEMDDVDVSGYVVAFEYGNSGTDQRRKLPEGTVIGGGQSLIVATGAKEVPIADVKLDYEGEVLNNDEKDVVALLTPDESTVIAKGDGSSDSTTTTTTEDEGSDDGGEESDGGDGTTSTETEDRSDDTNEESTGDDESGDDSESSDSGSSDGTSGEESGSEDESNDSESSDDDDSEEDC
ncbi:lamin tail domain-containing protein [Haladaptatus sp. DYF46]|uniref:lamin tail domain-containing protein n=1 Tax=Haladaptatus sp. DYF46 TaxID=2886041 RepID=UPI001E4C7F1D|nr:lamin tail domain-containing protein [Haladaptatus sp. DYF46]